MNLTALIAKVRRETLVTSTDVPDASITEELNNAYHVTQAAFSWPWTHGSYTLTTTANTQSYDMHNGGLKVRRVLGIVEIDERVRLYEMSPQEAWNRFGGKPPENNRATSYYVWDEKIWLLPKPPAVPAFAANTYTVYVEQQPADLSAGGDLPAFTAQFHHILADWAAARIWEREEDFEKAERAMARFREGLEGMARYYLNPGAEVVTVMGERRSRRGVSDPNMRVWLDG